MKHRYALLFLLPAACFFRAGAQDLNAPHRTFGIECAVCHTTADWKEMKKEISFDHGLTGFALEGRHEGLACNSCHGTLPLAKLSSRCVACHEDLHKGEFGDACADCHTPRTGWRDPSAQVARHALTRFPLLGRHLILECTLCHRNQQVREYANTPTACFSCHAADYASAKLPDHAAGRFDRACESCHTMEGWSPAAVDHDRTRFPLVGAHRAQPCAACHVDNNYLLAYTGCVQCHIADYNAAADPNHAASQFDTDCLRCHTQTSWKPSSFDHAGTRFPLAGAHLSVPCIQCHVNGNYRLVYTDCFQCHEKDFTGAQNPNHASAQFGHDCLQCHTQSGWRPASFDHANTRFPLQGAHLSTPCARCHVGGNYQLVYTDCWQCHQKDYTGAQNPNHASAQFGHDCLQCHTQSAWQPASFDHNATKFPLQGAHTTVACASCHVNGNYQLAYTGCWQCHQSDYEKTSDPADHAALNLDHDCLTCHTQSAWNPASAFRTTHSAPYPAAFPIYSGSHHAYPNRWTNCNQCHTSNNVKAFCCTLACHTNASSINNEHRDVRNYTYSCTSCATCHPSGKSD